MTDQLPMSSEAAQRQARAEARLIELCEQAAKVLPKAAIVAAFTNSYVTIAVGKGLQAFVLSERPAGVSAEDHLFQLIAFEQEKTLEELEQKLGLKPVDSVTGIVIPGIVTPRG